MIKRESSSLKDFMDTKVSMPIEDDRIPYQKPQPWGLRPDMVVKDLMTDDPRMWAVIAPGITSRPIHLNVTGGYYVHLLRVTRSGLLQRHRHSGQVHAYVIRGKWLYLEHDWVAEEGSYVFEPEGHLRLYIQHAQGPETLAQDLKELLK